MNDQIMKVQSELIGLYERKDNITKVADQIDSAIQATTVQLAKLKEQQSEVVTSKDQ